MKKLIERILIVISLIGGYGIMAAGIFALVILAGYLIIDLVIRTIEEPSIWVIRNRRESHRSGGT